MGTFSLDQALPAVRDAITKALGDIKLERLSKGEDGKVVFEPAFHGKDATHLVPCASPERY